MIRLRRLALILISWAALSAPDALQADSPVGCRRIADIVRDIDTGASPWLLDARFTLVDQ